MSSTELGWSVEQKALQLHGNVKHEFSSLHAVLPSLGGVRERRTYDCYMALALRNRHYYIRYF